MLGFRSASLFTTFILVAPFASAQERIVIDYPFVQQRAKEAASKPFVRPRDERPLPPVLKALNYSDYLRIRFRRDIAPWKDENVIFHLNFFFPGYSYEDTVLLNEFTKTHAQRIRFMPNLFEIHAPTLQGVEFPENLGYAGFRLLHPLNKAGLYDEVAVFQGASYFRMLGKGMSYGISARGLALNAGMPGVPEEFPIFTEFWIGKPFGNAPEATVYGLLNSDSVTGAYQFIIKPGETTECKVRATLFFRKVPQLIGVAPMSSMFWFGENTRVRPDDYRPEVHDSDGLAIRTKAGESIWRPVQNDPERLHQNVFQFTKDGESVEGFGLLQRDRDYVHYEDGEANYHQRPSLWVAPEGSWGPGRVHLVELSAHDETGDNLVAMWEPRDPPKVGEPFEIAYGLYWTSDPNPTKAGSYVVSSRTGLLPWRPGERFCVIDFKGPALDKLPAETQLSAVVAASDPALGEVKDVTVHKNAAAGTWRVTFHVRPTGAEPVKPPGPNDFPKLKPPAFKTAIEVRAFLKNGNDVLSETWNARLDP
jgi:periplasmic glucans biosynthesis protein